MVVPVALAVNQAHARVRRSRQETLHALETFANIVDERDPSTYRHSIRVAGYVDSLARALGLPYSDIDRLRWAGAPPRPRQGRGGRGRARASPASSTADRVGQRCWRAPRLSARLLRRFELSAAEARAVELHHERFDGSGLLRRSGRRPAARVALPDRRRQLRRDALRSALPPGPERRRGAGGDRARTSARSSTRPSRRRSSPCSAARTRTRR